MKIPVAVMSFDRPHYLEAVLQTALRQKGFGRFEPVFYLFQDGAVSPRTGTVYGNPDKMPESVEVFRKYVPDGIVIDSKVNLGVALNFDRAERVLFEEKAYEAAIFLEDDMLLQPHYFATMAQLMEFAFRRDDIGMFAAYGFRKSTPLAEQRARAHEICLMDEHNWAFGITRRAWIARDSVVRHYLDLISDLDYRSRGDRNNQIKGLQRALGRGGRGYLTSQDSMKNMACEVLGIHRINTFTNNARYIGKVGEHSTEERFKAAGHAASVLYDRPHGDFELPSSEALRHMRVGLANR
ncbi:MAG TPA: hypothetical protein VHL34_15785 [Rhizomicrobium sp.]|jgi:hypothetical protein|nr:hypothetical protein [Rhizomicrobium sp.]